MRTKIEELFQKVIRPLLEADGATLELVDVREHVVQVRLGGAYRGCPSTPYTVAGVLVPALQKATGEHFEVEVLV